MNYLYLRLLKIWKMRNGSKESDQVVASSGASPHTVILSVLGILLIGGLAIRHLDPPRARPSNAPIEEFSSARAMAHLQVIAKRPRPLGSPERLVARDYIFQQLSTAGLSPQIQNTTVTSRSPNGFISAAAVENIVATLSGAGSGKSVLLVSHYDSDPLSPGASDDGAGVATLLETLRALRNSPRLKNDVIFLFTDGEEAGLFGAKAFVAEHPLARNVGVVLNFEARGSSGPAIMFETSDGNGWLIDEFAQAAAHPVANSLSQELYKLLPNDTDFSVFKKAGLAGLNFAYISDHIHYHTATDSLDNIDERSLQHQGTYALGLSRRLGDLDLYKTATNNKVYFDLPGWGLVSYFDSWVKPLAALICALYIGLLVVGIRRKILSGPGLARGIGLFLMTLIISPIIALLASLLIGELYPGYKAFPLHGDTYNSEYYFIGYAGLAFAVITIVYGRWHKNASALNLAMGAMFWWLIPLIATSVFMPGGSYLFVWPLLFCLIAMGGQMFIGGAIGAFFKNGLLPLAGALPGIILWSPMIYLISRAFGVSLAPAVIFLMALMGGLCIPCVDQNLNRTWMSNRWLFPGIPAVLSVIALSAAIFTARIDTERPRPSSLFYAVNADSSKAIWATMDHELNDWTYRFLTDQAKAGPLNEFIPENYPGFLSAQAPIKEIAAPEIDLVSQSVSGAVKTSRFNVTSPRKAPIIYISSDRGAEIMSATINGKIVDAGGADLWGLRYLPLTEGGLDLVLVTKASSSIKLKVTDLSYGLPAFDELVSNPRPGWLIPGWFPYSDTTYVSKTYSF